MTRRMKKGQSRGHCCKLFLLALQNFYRFICPYCLHAGCCTPLGKGLGSDTKIPFRLQLDMQSNPLVVLFSW